MTQYRSPIPAFEPTKGEGHVVFSGGNLALEINSGCKEIDELEEILKEIPKMAENIIGILNKYSSDSSDDQMLSIKEEDKEKLLELATDIISVKKEDIEKLLKLSKGVKTRGITGLGLYALIKENIENLKNENKVSKSEISKMHGEIQALRRLINEQCNKIQDQDKKIQGLNHEVSQLKQENVDLKEKTRLRAWIDLARYLILKQLAPIYFSGVDIKYIRWGNLINLALSNPAIRQSIFGDIDKMAVNILQLTAEGWKRLSTQVYDTMSINVHTISANETADEAKRIVDLMTLDQNQFEPPLSPVDITNIKMDMKTIIDVCEKSRKVKSP